MNTVTTIDEEEHHGNTYIYMYIYKVNSYSSHHHKVNSETYSYGHHFSDVYSAVTPKESLIVA